MVLLLAVDGATVAVSCEVLPFCRLSVVGLRVTPVTDTLEVEVLGFLKLPEINIFTKRSKQ